jgi:hypothetical protein
MAEGIVVKRIDALREFRARLIKFNQGLADDFAAMERHWRDLHDIWHDDQYDQFGEALSEATPGISRYLTATEYHEAYLRRFIDQLQAATDMR